MYTFHRTSKDKLQSEAPLLVVSWNFISTLKRTNKKKKNPTNRITARHYFLLSALGNCTCCTSVSCMGEEGQSRRTQHPPRPPTFTSVWHCQTSCPSTPGLQATSMLSVWGKVDGGRVYCSSKAVCPSRSLHIQWPSCHQSLSQCTCRLSRCHSSGQMRIPWTEEDKNKLVLRQLTFSSSFEVKWKRLADYRARLDCNDIKFWPDAPQKDLFVGSIIQVQFSLIGESCQTAVAVPFLSETTVHAFGLAADRVYWSAYLEYAGAIRSPPSIQQIVLPSAYEPFTCKENSEIRLLGLKSGIKINKTQRVGR